MTLEYSLVHEHAKDVLRGKAVRKEFFLMLYGSADNFYP
jgi:hypothetical protein